jgi:ABC-type lipoprotein export system ATPase subunit
MSLLQIQNAIVQYTDATKVNLPDLELLAGQEIALKGPSGSGKTTLLHVLAGLVRPSSGTAVVAGLNLCTATVLQLEAYRSKTVALMFQDFHLLDGFSSTEQVTAVLGLSGMGIGNATREAKRLLERVSLGHRLHSPPSRLSTGERQRVALARALATKPKLLLVDEPTAHLDAVRGQVALELLRELAAELKAGLIVATHDPLVLNSFPHHLEVITTAMTLPSQGLQGVAA